MPIALAVSSTNDSSLPVRRLWDLLGPLECAASMAALNYPPHITLAVYDELDRGRADRVVDAVASRLEPPRVRFADIRHFEGEPLVLWAAPDPHPALEAAHGLVHAMIDPSSCRPHYRPGAWTPHCTLAMRIAEERRADALAFAGRPIEPFAVLFDRLDCLRFPRVTILRTVTLRHPAPAHRAASSGGGAKAVCRTACRNS